MAYGSNPTPPLGSILLPRKGETNMKQTKSTFSVKTLHLMCALSMLMMLVCQFLPYWSYGEGMSLSVQTYIGSRIIIRI